MNRCVQSAARVLAVFILAAGLSSPVLAQVQEISILPSSFDPASSPWDEYGTFFESNPAIGGMGATHTHVFGRAVGRITYWVTVPWTADDLAGRTVAISARLSSEFSGYSGPVDGISDVTLLVNGQPQPSQVVIADNGSGAEYTWNVQGSVLSPLAENQLAFAVLAESAHRNGLAIYQQAVVPGFTDAAISLRLSASQIGAQLDMRVGEGAFIREAHQNETLRLFAGADDSTIQVALSAEGSAGPAHEPLTYEWEIDGAVVEGQTQAAFAHLFSPGQHPVRVTVRTPDGAAGWAVGQVEIVLRNAEELAVGWPFTDLTEGNDGWHEVTGSTLHNGDDEYAQDWNWKAGASDLGRVLLSPADGQVLFAGRGTIRGFGQQVIILFNEPDRIDFAVRFAHMDDVWVRAGQTVCKGTPIGRLGNSGTDAYHLHAALYQGVFQTGATVNNEPISGLHQLLEGGRAENLAGGATRFATRFGFGRALQAGCDGGEHVIEGRVLRASGAAWGGVRVVQRDERGRPNGHGRSLDLSGNFVIRHVEAGTWEIEPSDGQCVFDPPSVFVETGDFHTWVGGFSGSPNCR